MTPATPPTVSVIIVSFNCRDLLDRCLSSLSSSTDLPLEIIVVDNASSDRTVELLQTNYPQIRLIANRDNRGFASATNQGIRASSSPNILLLNPDTEVCEGFLERLTAFLQTRPEAGAVGAQLLNPDGSIQTAGMYRRFPSLAQTALFFTFLRKPALASRTLRGRYFEDLCEAETAEADQLPGACILVRREVLEQTGLLDEDYFIWFEDIDLSYRIRQAGWRLYRLGEAKVFHVGGATLGSWDAEERFSRFTDMFFLFLMKNRGSGWATAHWLVLVAFALLEAPFVALRLPVARGRRRSLLKDYAFRLSYLIGARPTSSSAASGTRGARVPTLS